MTHEFTYKPLFNCDQNLSSGRMNNAQVHQVLLSTAEFSVEQKQELWMPPYILDKCQNKDFPSAAQKACPLACKTGEPGASDAFIGQKKWIGDSGRQTHTVPEMCGFTDATVSEAVPIHVPQ